MSTGTITRKEIIEDDALRWGAEYAKLMSEAIGKNQEFINSIMVLNAENVKLRRSENQTEYLKQKNDLKLITDKTILSLKEQQALEVSLEKVKQESLRTQKQELDVANKKAVIQNRSTKLTIEERVQNEANNRVLKQNARDMLGLTTAYEKLNRQRTEAKNRLRDLIVSENASSSAIRKAQKEFDDLDKKVRKADNAVGDFTKDVGNYKNALSGLRNLIGAFGIGTGLALFAQIAKDIFQTTKELQSLDLALKQVSGTDEEFAQNQRFLLDISEKYGTELKSLTKTYTQFYVAAKDKLAAREIQDIFDSVSKAAGFMGLSIEAQERAFLALNQMMSKGTIQAEELRGQLGEALPGSFGILAKALNVNEQQLGKMLQDGKLLAADVLPKFAKQLEKTYGIENKERVESLAASQGRLTNAYTGFIRAISEGDSVLSKFFSTTLDVLAQTLEGWNLLIQSQEAYIKNQKESMKSFGFQEAIDEIKALTNLTEEERVKRAEFYRDSQKELALSIQKETEELNKQAVEVAKTINGLTFRNEFIENRLERLNEQIRQNNNLIAISKGRIAGYNEVIQNYYKSSSDSQKELTDAEKKELEKRRQEYLSALKKRLSDEYALLKFRSDRSIELNQLVVDDEEKSIEERINAFLEAEQFRRSSAELTLRNEITQNALSLVDAKNTSIERMEQIQAEAKVRAQNIINGTVNLTNATNEEKLIYERYKKEVEDIDIKLADNRQKLIDSQVAIFKKAMDEELLAKDTALQKQLDAENLRYKAELDTLKQNNQSIQSAVLAHEREVKRIKEESTKESLEFQIKAINDILEAEKKKEEGAKLSNEKIAEYENQLAKYRKELNQLGIEDTENTVKAKEEAEKQYRDAVISLTRDMADSLKDIASNIFEARIQNIDLEIQKSQEYYDGQIELAGNDERQKDLLQKEAERKRVELEKKKAKEQYKQALVNRGFALAQIVTQTALASVAALAPPPVGLGPVFGGSLLPFIIGAGALQAAAVLSAPLPKYEKGTQGKPHKGGFAEVAEKRAEVIIEPNKAPYIIDKHSIVDLERGTQVISSVDEFKRMQKASYIASLNLQGKNVSDVVANQTFESAYSKEILEELKLNRKTLERKKQNIIIQNQGLDINFALWKNHQTNWG